MSDSNQVEWVYVEQWLPPVGQVVKATDGRYVIEAHIMLDGDWSFTYWNGGRDDAGPVIAWLYEPPIEMPKPPTVEDHERWLMNKHIDIETYNILFAERNTLADLYIKTKHERDAAEKLLIQLREQLEVTTDLGEKRWQALNDIYEQAEKRTCNWCKRKAAEGLGIERSNHEGTTNNL